MRGKSSACRLCLLLVSVVTVAELSSAQVTTPKPERKVIIPPLITTHPPKSLAFRVGQSIELACVATGEPTPTYKWMYNSENFDPSGNEGRIAVQPGVGTLIFAPPIKKDEGIYQCFAANKAGISTSVKTDLRMAILESFQPQPHPIVRRPPLGHAQTLKCTPPKSFPKPLISWGVSSGAQGFKPLDLTDRVSVDPEGNLHIANILRSDRQNGHTYACLVYNKVMMSIKQGDYQKIEPQGERVNNMPPREMWADPTTQVALRGNTWRVKCIFGGRPTPRVDWHRLEGGPMPSRASQESFGQELVISNVQLSDAGKYECQGINDETQVPIRRSFTLQVQSAPYWKTKPASLDVAENDKAVFHCKAEGVPEPKYTWFLNGIPVSKLPKDPRRIQETTRMTFLNVTLDNKTVIQCNTTNKHGYSFANAYLNVLSEPPIILDPPKVGQKVAEGQNIQLMCRVFGAPKPLVIWRKGSEQLTGGRFTVLPEGHLNISDVSLVDAGVYTCSAENKFGDVRATGSLIVRRKTQIQTKPLDITVYEGTEAKFTCTATTDPEEVSNLQINWKKDGQIIDYKLAQRVFKNDMDNSLTISGTINLDTAKYSCVASNGLDQSESSAQLIVQGKPDSPNSVRVRCTKGERKAIITWQPSKENYAPILNFIIQFNTSFTPDTWIDIASNVSQNDRQKEIILSPWGNYTFRVLARNKIGMSPPSRHTETVCTTEAGRPNKNPENVVGEGDQVGNLIIYWTAMPKIEQNGPGFYYTITYRRADIANSEVKVQRVDFGWANHHIIPENMGIYKPYNITVKAANDQGDSTVTPRLYRGYSGEDQPVVAPTDLMFQPDSVSAHRVTISWSPVDTNPDSIRGFFRGYRVQFWKTNEGEERMQEEDYIINEPKTYPRARRYKRSTHITTYTLKHLPPFSELTLQIRVLNKYYVGPASNQINIVTKEGEPGPPAGFDVIARGSTHFELKWTKPLEQNGILVGYNISYQTITGLNLGRLQYRKPITNPDQLRARLTGLQPEHLYRVYLHAVTKAGQGDPIFLDMKTTPAATPSPPTFVISDVRNTSVNVTWEPSRSGNPGSVFYVQYKLKGMYHWEQSPEEVDNYYRYISGLFTGRVYQIRVVSKNGVGFEAASHWQEFKTGGSAPGRAAVASTGWFIGMFVILFLIILLVVGFFVLRKKREEWWEQQENKREEQVRALQAQIAADQMGIVNQYAQTGSRELYDQSHGSSFGSDYKKSVPEDEYVDDDDEYDDEEDEYNEKAIEAGRFTKEGLPTSAYAPQSTYAGQHPGYVVQQPSQYNQGPPRYDEVPHEPEPEYSHPQRAHQVQPLSQEPQVGYRPPEGAYSRPHALPAAPRGSLEDLQEGGFQPEDDRRGDPKDSAMSTFV